MWVRVREELSLRSRRLAPPPPPRSGCIRIQEAVIEKIQQASTLPFANVRGLNQLKTKGAKMELSMTQPDDWHLHLCDGDLLEGVSSHSDFIPLMTLYLTDTTTPEENKLARESGVVYAVKRYPAGATTNSQDGVTDLFGKCLPVLEEMVKHNMPLLTQPQFNSTSIVVKSGFVS
ncbi:hypothetical protein HYC85_014270 [Camellia sinensis]|uniref:Dihydroorotase n=1 Tax=Camellia sinensis TaxID=4442 RepID=A0A7J7H5R1_CAMSI|nr:hypothetical protein HYC85_014270 [Camellia sinensis]